MHNPEWDAQSSLGFWDIDWSPDLDQTTRPSEKKKKKKKRKRTCRTVDFAVLADHRVELKEIEPRDKYQDLAREHECNAQ